MKAPSTLPVRLPAAIIPNAAQRHVDSLSGRAESTPQQRDAAVQHRIEATVHSGAVTLLKARLLVVQGLDQGRRFEVTQPTVWIGRAVQNEIRILDSEVSRRHAILFHENGSWYVRDAGSSNGTFVNGQPATVQPLSPGDQLQVGRTILLFTEIDSPESSLISRKVDFTHDAEASQIVSSVNFQAGRAFEQHAVSGLGDAPPSDANLAVLYRISEEVVRPTGSLDQLLKRILDLSIDAVRADRGVMFVADSRTDSIEPRVVSLRDGVSLSDRFPVSRTIVEYVIQHGHGVHTTDARHDARFEEGQSILKAGIREAMCVPIQGRYELLGVIYVDITTNAMDRAINAGRFSKELLTLLLAIGRQSALAVENNRYQQALVSAERLAAVGQAIAVLAHDIKNILQGMKGGGYLLDQGLKNSEVDVVRKGWGIVQRNQDRIFNLVMDMLSFSKDRPPRLRLANVNDTVREIYELVQPGAEEQHIEILLSLADGPPSSLFDPDAIHRAVLNIVTNALEAVAEQEDAKVWITTAFDTGENAMRIDIRDNGPGIPQNEIPVLFDLFRSEKGSRGTGLGLAVSQKILREHGGEIRVESVEGEGTLFSLTWPYHEEDLEGSSVNQLSAS